MGIFGCFAGNAPSHYIVLSSSLKVCVMAQVTGVKPITVPSTYLPGTGGRKIINQMDDGYDEVSRLLKDVGVLPPS